MALTLTGTLTPRYGSSLVAPLVVHADVYGLTIVAGSETDPLHKAHYSWDFGDPNSAETFTDPVTGTLRRSNSDQIGPQASHIYRTPGTYRVTVTASYFDAGSSTWLTATKASAYFTVLSESAANWDVGYYDPSDTGSLQDGTRDEPYVSLAQAQAFLNRRSTRALYIARGSTIVPKSSSVQTITVSATGGTFKITFTDVNGNTEQTGTIAYNASIYAVYAALRELPSIGRRGVVVSRIDPVLYRHIYDFRSVVEPLAVELATRRPMTRDERREGERIVAAGWKAKAGDDTLGMVRADVEFHSFIYRLSANSVIENTMRIYWQHIRRAMVEILRGKDYPDTVWSQHEAIFTALAEERTADASAVMRQHIVGGFAVIELQRIGQPRGGAAG